MLPEEPIFSSYYKLGDLTYKKGDGSIFSGPPCLEGIDFGCRTGVIFSPCDLTCGWDGHEHPRGTRVVIDQARQVGANMITYMLGTFQLGPVPQHDEGLLRGVGPHAATISCSPS